MCRPVRKRCAAHFVSRVLVRPPSARPLRHRVFILPSCSPVFPSTLNSSPTPPPPSTLFPPFSFHFLALSLPACLWVDTEHTGVNQVHKTTNPPCPTPSNNNLVKAKLLPPLHLTGHGSRSTCKPRLSNSPSGTAPYTVSSIPRPCSRCISTTGIHHPLVRLVLSQRGVLASWRESSQAGEM